MIVSVDKQLSDVSKAVEFGLAQSPKQLPSWLFYDEAGDKIFQSIMAMPEYYLTASEYEILDTYKDELWHLFKGDDSMFDLVEFGAGDGIKTEVLLKHFAAKNTLLKYQPVDVSRNALSELTTRLERSVPVYPVFPIALRYDDAIDHLAVYNGNRRVFLFMGANIGNFTLDEATQFVSRLAGSMNDHDQLLIGFDLKKEPRLILTAYDDPHGITRNFNLNLLTRLNRELGADFKLENFDHCPSYNPETGEAKSFLVSNVEQDVDVNALDRVFHFDAWEAIETEISLKYDMTMIAILAEKAGLSITGEFYDSQHYFVDVLFRKKI